MIPDWATPSCDNVGTLAFAYGAGSHLLRIDTIFRGLGAPPVVHHALVGGLADYQCGTLAMDKQLAICMAAGVAGGVVTTVILGG